jgi:ABC-type transporter Mla MlaB component
MRKEVNMGIQVIHHQDENRLDLTVEDTLDLTLVQSFMEACGLVDERLQTCVIDCTRVARVFDSGLALLLMLVEKLKKYSVRLIMLGEVPGLQFDKLQLNGSLLLSRCGGNDGS